MFFHFEELLDPSVQNDWPSKRFWGRWDGGKDEAGVGYGWKLWAMNETTGKWEAGAFEAGRLADTATVTEAELSMGGPFWSMKMVDDSSGTGARRHC